MKFQINVPSIMCNKLKCKNIINILQYKYCNRIDYLRYFTQFQQLPVNLSELNPKMLYVLFMFLTLLISC